MQSIFDKVVTHLLTQGRKAINEAGGCRYRYGALKCAAGCLIPDEDYRPEFEGKAVDISPTREYFRTKFTEDQFELIRRLQRIHDQSAVGDWPLKLKQIAKHYGLSYNGPPSR